MKYIRKGNPPRDYARWCADAAQTNNADWRNVPGAEKTLVLDAMISEQGALCAYTMRRIHQNSSHVEHIKPQSVCRMDEPGTDLDYRNLVACFPRESMPPAFCYGARKKDKWWDNGGTMFVSPLVQGCERSFRFDLDGEIATVRNSPRASTTIDVLALNHRSLAEDRKRVIEEFIYGSHGNDPMSSAVAARAKASICNRRDDGQFYEFCVAIRSALDQHLSLLRKRARRRQLLRRNR